MIRTIEAYLTRLRIKLLFNPYRYNVTLARLKDMINGYQQRNVDNQWELHR